MKLSKRLWNSIEGRYNLAVKKVFSTDFFVDGYSRDSMRKRVKSADVTGY